MDDLQSVDPTNQTLYKDEPEDIAASSRYWANPGVDTPSDGFLPDAGDYLWEAKHTDSSTVPNANRCEVFVRYARSTPKNQIRAKCYFFRYLKDVREQK